MTNYTMLVLRSLPAGIRMAWREIHYTSLYPELTEARVLDNREQEMAVSTLIHRLRAR